MKLAPSMSLQKIGSIIGHEDKIKHWTELEVKSSIKN